MFDPPRAHRVYSNAWQTSLRDVFAPTLAEGDGPGSRAKAEQRIGEVVARRYRLSGILGFGGMGTVFEAEHTELGKRFAVKVLSSSFSGHPNATARFLREAKAASAIESEHIAQVFDVGEDPVFGLFMILELLKGEDLSNALRSRGSLRPVDAAAIAWQICLALERAHGAGIVHRDLKPANVFLTPVDDGSILVKVLDFGIAKLVSEAKAAHRGSELTQIGLAVGTPQYMSPEQALAGPVDHRTDIYSLGAVLYEAIAGKAAYPECDSGQATMAKVLTEKPPRLSTIAQGVSAELDALVAAMMERDPEARPQSAAETRARLAAIFPGIGRTRLVIGGSVRPPPVEVIAAPPRHGAGPPSGDRDATTVKGPKTTRSGSGALLAALVAFVVVATALVVLVRIASPGSSSVAAPSATASAALSPRAAIEQTIDPLELVRASQRALARGDSSRARELALVASQRAPTVGGAWLALGAANEALGDRSGARGAYESCAEQAKDDGPTLCRAKLAH